jgi:uncharacterized repeat protein (TIGR01451 family)
LLLVATGLVWAATASQAAPQACTVAGGFEIDGDMTPGTATCVPAGLDWTSTPPLTVAGTTQGGTYKTAAKDDSDPATWQSAGATPNKADFQQAYATSHVAKVGGTDHFFTYVAWERTDTTGTQGYAIEVDNAPARVAADGTPQPDRSQGGTVFYLSANGSNAPIFNGSCKFTSQADYGTNCPNDPANLSFAVNKNTITDPINNTTQIAGSFFEVALDITGLNGIVPSCPGAAATTVYLRSITGQTFNGNLKGYMAPLSVAPDSTCKPPPITTTATPGGSAVTSGDPQHDVVNVGDPNGSNGAPTPAGVGSVTFFLCSPAEVTANGGDCSKAGTQVGLAHVLDANGQATSDDVTGSTNPADNALGKYCWRAEFTPSAGDHNYLAGSHTNSDTECFTVTPPSLALTKTADAATVSAGDSIGFTLTASNSNAQGTATAKAATLDDPLPSGAGISWSISPAYAGPGTCSITAGAAGAQVLHCSFGDLAPGATASVHITSSTQFASCQAYPNTATLNAANAQQPVQASATTTVLCPALTFTKTADNATVSAGSQIGFTITAANGNAPGTGAAHNVTIDDPLPSGGGVDWSISPAYGGPGTCSITGKVPAQTLSCALGTLQPGASASVHVVSGTDKTSCQQYPNVATLAASNNPQLQANATTTVACATVSITKTADHSAPVNAGDQIGFTVEVKNAGPGDATGVVLDDKLPAGSGSGVTWAIDPAVGTPAQFVLAGAQGAQTLSLASGTVPVNADYKVHITAATSQTECSGTYDNTATLTTGNANNPSPVSASESCAYHVDLAVTKAGSPATQVLGQGNITWTIVVTNNGPDTDTGVTIADPMPAGNTFVSATTSQGSCTGGAILNCNIGTMAAGAQVTITLVTTPSAAGAQTNTVTVVGDRPETNTANNQATATVQVTAPFVPPPVYCVAVSKITPNQLFVGRKTMLTIHLTKHGQAAKGVRVLIKGPKLNLKTKPSNARGIVKQVIKMKKSGIDTFIPLASKHCNTKRVGVTGVFTPPVTG